MTGRRWTVAVLDDYQDVAMAMADWSSLGGDAAVTVFNDHLDDHEQLVQRLEPFDIVCVMRERTPLPRSVIERLPRLRLIASTGSGNASIDLKAAADHGVAVAHTGYSPVSTVELTWALILAGARDIAGESDAVRDGRWQQIVGDDLSGHTLGVLGLGRIGSEVARIGLAFGMDVIAWSQNLTTDRAASLGARRVEQAELFAHADVLTIHLVLSDRTRGLVSARELELMKPTARLVNTSRGPILVEEDLLKALWSRQIGGAAVDVFDQEPLPVTHPLRSAPRLLATPHIGYVTRSMYERFYGETVENIRSWLDEQAADQ